MHAHRKPMAASEEGKKNKPTVRRKHNHNPFMADNSPNHKTPLWETVGKVRSKAEQPDLPQALEVNQTSR